MKLKNVIFETSEVSTIVDFFKSNPSPKDDEIHQLASELRIDKHRFEEIIYNLLGSFLGGGLSSKFKGSYDKNQLAKGTQVELEHTDNKVIAKKIAMDHLAEMPDYYDKLEVMESENQR